jgi:hypothetical protein
MKKPEDRKQFEDEKIFNFYVKVDILLISSTNLLLLFCLGL